MKKLVILVSLIAPLLCTAQKQGNMWHFGDQQGLDFSSGVPVVLTNSQIGSDATPFPQEGTASICDSAGSLLFYTGGETIWNRNHQPMPNGTGIMGGTSSTQSSLIVPLPGSDSIFYVFTADEFQGYNNQTQKGYRYSVVDMCLDNGYGDVMTGQKNILLLDSATEKLAACRDANGNGYWIVGHKMFSDEFRAWHLTSGGITNTVVSQIGTVHGWNNINLNWFYGRALGQMKLNPQGTKLALALGNADPAVLDLFDFDNNTGVISNQCRILLDSALHKRTYGVEFSPDGTKLYASGAGGSGGKRLYQFDVTAGGGDCDSVKASRAIVFQSNGNSVMNGMQLAPNGKIYVVGNDYYSLSCINYPDSTGLAADFDLIAVVLPRYNSYTLPSFIAGYSYHNGIIHCCNLLNVLIDLGNDITICKADSVMIGQPPVVGYSYSWSLANGLNPNDTNNAQPVVYPSVTTTYYLSVTDTLCGNTVTDSITVFVVSQPSANAGPDTVICEGASVVIGTPATNGLVYYWAPATALNNVWIAQPTANPIQTTTYRLRVNVVGYHCEHARDTVVVYVTQSLNPVINPVGPICKWHAPILLTATISGGTFTGTGVNDPFFDPWLAGVGTHTITYEIDTNGCVETTTLDIVVTECPGIQEIITNKQFTICPNPTTGVFTVSGSAAPVKVFDLLGNLVLCTKEREIDLSAHPAGIYFVRVGERTQKLALSK